MNVKPHVVKELTLFQHGCDFEFLISLRQFKCYKTSKGDYIAIIQMNNYYDINLHNVQVIDKHNKKKMERLELTPLRIDKKYKLYEILI